ISSRTSSSRTSGGGSSRRICSLTSGGSRYLCRSRSSSGLGSWGAFPPPVAGGAAPSPFSRPSPGSSPLPGPPASRRPRAGPPPLSTPPPRAVGAPNSTPCRYADGYSAPHDGVEGMRERRGVTGITQGRVAGSPREVEPAQRLAVAGGLPEVTELLVELR